MFIKVRVTKKIINDSWDWRIMRAKTVSETPFHKEFSYFCTSVLTIEACVYRI